MEMPPVPDIYSDWNTASISLPGIGKETAALKIPPGLKKKDKAPSPQTSPMFVKDSSDFASYVALTALSFLLEVTSDRPGKHPQDPTDWEPGIREEFFIKIGKALNMHGPCCHFIFKTMPAADYTKALPTQNSNLAGEENEETRLMMRGRNLLMLQAIDTSIVGKVKGHAKTMERYILPFFESLSNCT
ncbi:MAG: hypothetical protein LBT40_04980 [Deltaproteobacteria bacterium]|jgi:hypothetical protein|nr:hypothetical protein [Deltaproteobacteria bacterium]